MGRLPAAHPRSGFITEAVVAVVVWVLGTFVFIYFWPRIVLRGYKRATLVKGFGDGPIPVNTLYTQPQALFADPQHIVAIGKLAIDELWHKPRHALYRRCPRSLQGVASSPRAGHGRPLLRGTVH